MAKIQIVHESVVDQETDVIVNAANGTMLGGGGVDEAIHKAAGPQLYDFFKQMNKMWKAGDVELSPGFNAKARFILHAVGPIWNGGNNGEQEQLKRCYVGCLEKAAEVWSRSISFCCISTGIFGYPLDAATRIALTTVREWLDEHKSSMLVKFCCFTKREFDCYRKIADEIGLMMYLNKPLFSLSDAILAKSNQFTDRLWKFREVYNKLKSDKTILNCIHNIRERQMALHKEYVEKLQRDGVPLGFSNFDRELKQTDKSLLSNIDDDSILDPIIEALPHLHLGENERLDLIIDGYMSAAAVGEFKIKKEGELYPLKVGTDGSKEAAWERVILDEASGQFYRFWHAAYGSHQIITDIRKDKEVFCVERYDSSVWSRLSDDSKARLLKNNFGPVVRLSGNQASVRYYIFSYFGGLFKEVANVDLLTGEIKRKDFGDMGPTPIIGYQPFVRL